MGGWERETRLAEWGRRARGPLRMMGIFSARATDLPLEAARHAGICRMLDCRRLGGGRGASATRVVVRKGGGRGEGGRGRRGREGGGGTDLGGLRERAHRKGLLCPAPISPGVVYSSPASPPGRQPLCPPPHSVSDSNQLPLSARSSHLRAALSTRPPAAFLPFSRHPAACRSLRRRCCEFSSISRTSSAVGQHIRSASVLS